MTACGAGAPAGTFATAAGPPPEPAERLLGRLADPALRKVAERTLAGERLSFEDGLVLFRSPDLLGVGALANRERERRHGNRGYYNVNRYLNPTNLCWVDCGLCAWARKPGVAGGYTMAIEEAVSPMLSVSPRLASTSGTRRPGSWKSLRARNSSAAAEIASETVATRRNPNRLER